MVIMNDLEWPMLSYYVIYFERFRKVMQQTEKVALMYSTLEWAIGFSVLYKLLNVVDLTTYIIVFFFLS